jgi:hypothetical protein
MYTFLDNRDEMQMPNAEMLKTIIQQILKVKQSPICTGCGIRRTPSRILPWNNTDKRTFDLKSRETNSRPQTWNRDEESHDNMMKRTGKGARRGMPAP